LANLDFYTVELEKIQQELFDKLEKTIIGLKGLTDRELLRITGQIDLFEEMNRLGYSTLLGRVGNAYDDQIAIVFGELSRRELARVPAISITTLEQLKTFDMEFLSQGVEQYARQLKSAMVRNLVARESVENIIDNLTTTLGPGNVISSRQFNFLINESFARFQHTVRGNVYENIPEAKFTYSGPTAGNRRDSCIYILTKVKRSLTREEIDNLKVPPQKDGSTFEGFVARGGYNCNHDWIRSE